MNDSIEKIYKSAAFIFYRYKYVPVIGRISLQVYLQYEKKFQMWSHFGGKRELCDRSSYETALRELYEESTDLATPDIYENSITSQYFPQSKMVVYYVRVREYDFCINEHNWFNVEYLPTNLRPHVRIQIFSL